MTRRKKPSHAKRGRSRAPAAQEADSPSASASRPAPPPNPARPNKPLLVATSLLLAAWIAVLIALAVAT